MESEGMLRHLVFFEELGKMDERDAGWRAVSAGLVTMRLVDQWIAAVTHLSIAFGAIGAAPARLRFQAATNTGAAPIAVIASTPSSPLARK